MVEFNKLFHVFNQHINSILGGLKLYYHSTHEPTLFFTTPVMILVHIKWTLSVDVCNQFGGCISFAYNFNTSNNPSTHLALVVKKLNFYEENKCWKTNCPSVMKKINVGKNIIGLFFASFGQNDTLP